MCLLNGCVVYRGKKADATKSEYTITVTQSRNSESPIAEFPASCDHYLPYGLLTDCRATRGPAFFLTEGRPHPNCRVIRTYDIRDGNSRRMYENVEPHKICNGPRCGLLVCDWTVKSVLHLVLAGDKLLCTHQLKLDFLPIQGMCYSNHSNAVIFSKVGKNQVFAFNLVTGDKLWLMSQFVYSITLNPEDVCSTPQGWICVANRTNLLFLTPGGHLVSVLHLENITERSKLDSQVRIRDMFFLSADSELNIEWTNDMTVQPVSDTQVSLLDQMDDGPQPNVTVSMVSQKSYVKLHPTEYNLPLEEDRAQSDVIMTSHGFHKVMCCESDKGPVLAVRHEEGTIITYKLTSIPDGRVVLEN